MGRLRSEAPHYWADVVGRGTIKAALSGPTSKAPGFAGGYLLILIQLFQQLHRFSPLSTRPTKSFRAAFWRSLHRTG
jgi:hypothetical protein